MRVETRQDVDQAIDAGARRLAEQLGVGYTEGYHAFLSEPEGRRLYELSFTAPVGALPAPEIEPTRFTEDEESPDRVWATIVSEAAKQRKPDESTEHAISRFLQTDRGRELYNRYNEAVRARAQRVG